MSSFNKVILLGNLTRDPEMRTTANGTVICKFAVATSRVARNSKGESSEEVLFIDVDAFGKQGETIGRFFSKGRPIFIEGRLKLDMWESPSGEKRSKIFVVLESFQFVGSSRLEDDIHDKENLSEPATSRAPIELKPASSLQDNDSVDLDEDVPF